MAASQITLTHPTGICKGMVRLPASKSIANRLLLMRAVAGFSDLQIHNLSNARDTVILNRILSGLAENSVADVHDAGTVMRFLTAYLSCLPGERRLTGTARMQQRPIGALVEVLRKLGADITYENNQGYPPLKIKGKQLLGGKVEVDGSVSSQFLSALLMIAPLYKQPLQLHIKNQLVSVPYVQMTLQLMNEWGISHRWKENVIEVDNKPYRRPTTDVFVESDWSAASYFYSIVALAPEAEITLPHLFKNSLQGDRVCAEVFQQLGVATGFSENGVVLKKNGKAEKEFKYHFIKCPDIAQTLAACCAAKGIGAELTGLQTLTVKETDRIAALKNELEKCGAKVQTTPSSIHITPSNSSRVPHPSSLVPCPLPLDTYHDHRMAMSFAPLALLGETHINDPAVVEKSFPHFWDELKRLGFVINEM